MQGLAKREVCLHLLLLVLVVIVLLVGLGGLGLGGRLLLGLLGVLDLLQGLPLLGELVGLGDVIGDDDVVEDGAALHLPQVEADEAEVGELVDLGVVDEVRVGDLLGLPDSLVGRVGDALHVPLALVAGVVLHGGLPLAILLIVPVIGLHGIGVHDSLLVDPVLRLLVLRVVHHGVVHPVGGLLVLGILDLLGGQELPVILHGALVDALLVDLHLHGVVRLHHQPVQVGGALLLLLVGEVLLLQHVLALVVEDEVGPLGVAALVRAEHDVVGGGVAEGREVRLLRADLHVATAALHILLVLGLVLDDEVLAGVAEGVEAGRDAEELGVLTSLEAGVLGLVLVVLASGGHPLAGGALALLPLARGPSALPAVTKGLGEVDLAIDQGREAQAQSSLSEHGES
mmetsp:Transcript_23051/g.34412  ORF Transcript_23051/g.34412 Transcript_23051/m.34412 type:complete len:400 (+) Transcript_23051:181-1380(+)